MIKIKLTNRGFARGEFKDRYGAACSIQKSSLADEECIWLGCEHETIHEVTKEPCGARMHLTRQMAADIVMHLQRFIETGDIQ